MTLSMKGILAVALFTVVLVGCGGSSDSPSQESDNATSGSVGQGMNDPSLGGQSTDNGNESSTTGSAGNPQPNPESVSDNDGGTTTGGEVVISDPEQLAVLSLTVTPEQQVVNEVVTFAWVITDIDESLECRLDIDRDGNYEYNIENCEVEGSISHTYSQVGNYTALLEVSSLGQRTSQSVSIVIEPMNTPPEIIAFDSVDEPVMVYEPVKFTWDIIDINEDALVCELDVEGDGIADYTVADCNSASTLTHYYSSPGDYEPKLTVIDPFDDTDTETLEVHILPLMVKVHALALVSAGSKAQFELRISNVSSSVIKNVGVLHRVPANLSFGSQINAFPDVRGCFRCSEGSEATWNFNSLAPGETRYLTIDATVSDSLTTGEQITAPFIVSADTMRSQIVIDEVIQIDNRPKADLALSTSSTSVLAGESIDLTVVAGNISSTDLLGAQIQLRVPRGASVDRVFTEDGSYDETTRVITWDIASVPLLQSLSRTVRLRSNVDASDGLILPFSAQLSLENELSKSTGLAIPVVTSVPALEMVVAPAANPIIAGNRVHFQVTVSNRSLVPINNVGVLLRLPADISLRSTSDATPDLSGCSTCGQYSEASWIVGTLNSGESRTLRVNALVSDLLQSGTVRTLPLTLVASGVDITQHERLVVRVDNDLKAELSAQLSKNPVTSGEEFELSVDIGNAKSINLQNASLQVQIPTGLSVTSIETAGGVENAEDGLILWDSVAVDSNTTARFVANLTANTDVIAGQAYTINAELNQKDSAQIDGGAGTVLAIGEIKTPLNIDIKSIESTARPGERLKYQFILTNNGLIPLKNVTLVFRVPKGISFRSSRDATPDGRGCSNCRENTEPYWSYASIAAGASETIELNSLVDDVIPPGSLISAPIFVVGDNLPNTQFTVYTVPVQ